MHSSLYIVFTAVSWFIRLIYSAILVFAIMSWFRPSNKFYMLLGRFIAPFVMPFRRFSMFLMNRTRIPVDLSLWIASTSLIILNRLWWQLYSVLYRLTFL